jgi:WD40 repeat protein
MTVRLRTLLVAVALTLLGTGPTAAAAAPGDRPRTDRYGDPLPDGAVARFGTTRWKHPGGVAGVVFSPDGKTVASVGDRIPRLWDAATGKELRRFLGHEAPVSCVLSFRDGKTLVTGDGDGAIRLWDVATGKEKRRLVNPTRPVTALALAPDGKTLASGGRNGDPKIYLWDTASGRLLRSWLAHAEDVWVLAFSPDGKLLVSGGESKGRLAGRPKGSHSAAAWDPATGKKRYQIGRLVCVQMRKTPGDQDDPNYRPRYGTTTDPERVAALAFSRDGELLATGGYAPPHRCWMVRLRDSATGKERRLQDGKADAKAIAFSPDGKLLVAQDERALVFWDVVRGTRLGPVEGVLPPGVGFSGVTALTFSPRGRTLACGCSSGDVRLWEVASASFSPEPSAASGPPGRRRRLTERFAPRGHQKQINAIVVSPDGRLAFTAGEGPGGRLWELATGKEVRKLEGGWWYVTCSAFSPDGKTVATGHRMGASFSGTRRPANRSASSAGTRTWSFPSPSGEPRPWFRTDSARIWSSGTWPRESRFASSQGREKASACARRCRRTAARSVRPGAWATRAACTCGTRPRASNGIASPPATTGPGFFRRMGG